ncbi:MAG: signal peptidase I [Ilumatobacteraceae bacterium]|nr:signal peptidase I [Ilumatobacteraceae bacterium]
MNNGENTYGSSALIRRLLVEWVGVIGIALVIAIVVRMFLLQQFYISGPSMETTMFTNNRVLVNKLAYQIGDVKRGDVVVFDRATVNGNDVVHDDLIKRVIALGGETISIKSCVVYINGTVLPEPYLPARDTEMTDPQDRCSTVDIVDTVIPQGEFFLMGDNRPQSYDSRMFGPITREMIVGRAFVIIWPVTQWHFL